MRPQNTAARSIRQPRRRRGEQGQMAPLLGIFAVLLLLVMAIATDLSVSTHYKRALQNVTDAAALAGAAQLPASPALADQVKAEMAALQMMHNTYQWDTSTGDSPSNLAQGGTCTSSGCSVTVCAGLTSTNPPCTVSPSPLSATPFVLTINTPPKTARIAQFNSSNLATDPHYLDRIEVVMRQSSGGFFSTFTGQSNDQDAAQSVGYHFASGQPFSFALYSHTIVQSGNQGETIAGNIYADRYVAPQSRGKAGICSQGYIFLGYPQQDDGAAYNAVTNPGQSTSLGDPIQDGSTCPASKGVVAMTANPQNDAGCAAGLPANASGATVKFDAADGACEANPSIQPPQVATPSPLKFASTVCGTQGIGSNGHYQMGEYKCASGAALTVDHLIDPGMYEIDAGNNGGCDVSISNPLFPLTGVTFYLKGGAGICFSISSGDHITQTPWTQGNGAAGDGRYVVYSDNVGTPSISIGSSGGGSTSGFWDINPGVVWLPTGSISFSNKAALTDSGQIIVNSWNDSSGNHANSSITYNPAVAPPLKEQLQLSE